MYSVHINAFSLVYAFSYSVQSSTPNFEKTILNTTSYDKDVSPVCIVYSYIYIHNIIFGLNQVSYIENDLRGPAFVVSV